MRPPSKLLALVLVAAGCTNNVALLRKTLNREDYHEMRYLELCVSEATFDYPHPFKTASKQPIAPPYTHVSCLSYQTDLKALRKARAALETAIDVGGDVGRARKDVQDLLKKIDDGYR